MREALGYFYVTDKGIYYISIELVLQNEDRKFYRVVAYDVEARKFLYNDIVPAKSVERLEKALLELVESVQPSEVSKRKKAK